MHYRIPVQIQLMEDMLLPIIGIGIAIPCNPLGSQILLDMFIRMEEIAESLKGIPMKIEMNDIPSGFNKKSNNTQTVFFQLIFKSEKELKMFVETIKKGF